MLRLEGHKGAINTIAFSPHDNRILASGADDGRVRLWNTKTGEAVQKFSGHHDAVIAIAFSSKDTQVLASASQDGTVLVWNTVTCEIVQKLEVYLQEITAMAFSPHNEQVLATVALDGIVRLWNATTGEEMQKLDELDLKRRVLAFSPHHRQVLATTSENSILLWDTGAGLIRKLTYHEEITALAFSIIDKDVLASGSQWDHTVCLWNTTTGEVMQRIHIPVHSLSTHQATALAFSPSNGQLLALAGVDNSMRLCDTATGKVIRKLKVHDDIIDAITFSPIGELLASASRDGIIRLWSAKYGEAMLKLGDDDSTVNGRPQLDEGTSRFGVVVFSLNGQASASTFERTVLLWNPLNGKMIQGLEGHRGSIRCLALSTDSQVLASLSEDETIRLWDPTSGGTMRVIGVQDIRCNSVVFSSDGKVLAGSCLDKIVLWDVANGDVTRVINAGNGYAILAFSPDGQMLAAGHIKLQLWNVATGALIHTLDQSTMFVDSLEFSPDSQLIASVSRTLQTSDVQILNALTYEAIQEFQSSKFIFQLSFTDDNRTLKTNAGDFDLTEDVAANYVREPTYTVGVTLRNEWIQFGNQELWLPQEYRGRSWALHDNTLIIRQRSGHVSFFRCEQPTRLS